MICPVFAIFKQGLWLIFIVTEATFIDKFCSRTACKLLFLAFINTISSMWRGFFDSVGEKQNCSYNTLHSSRQGSDFARVHLNWVCHSNTEIRLSCSSEKSPARNDILRWHKNFLSNGNLGHRAGNSRPLISEERLEEARQLFSDDFRLSTRRTPTVLNMPSTTVHRILVSACIFSHTGPKICTYWGSLTEKIEYDFLIAAKKILMATSNSFKGSFDSS